MTGANSSTCTFASSTPFGSRWAEASTQYWASLRALIQYHLLLPRVPIRRRSQSQRSTEPRNLLSGSHGCGRSSSRPESFPWRGCAVKVYGVQARAELQELLASCGVAAAALQDTSTGLAQVLQLPAPQAPKDASHLLRVGEVLARAPRAERRWLLRPEIESLISTAQRYRLLAASRREASARIEQRYEAQVFDIAPDVQDHLRSALGTVVASLGSAVATSREFVARRHEALNTICDLHNTIDLWRREVDVVTEALGLPRVRDLDGIKRLLQVGELCRCRDRPDRSWLVVTHLDGVFETVRRLKADHDVWSSKRRATFREFETSFLDLDLEEFSRRYTDRYQSSLRWLRPGFYRLRRAARRHHRGRKHVPDLLYFLEEGRDIQRLEKKLAEQAPEVAALLRECYRGYETDFPCVAAAAETAKELISLVGSPVPDSVSAAACLGGALAPDLSARFDRIRASVSRWEQGLVNMPTLLSGTVLPTSRLSLGQTDLDEVRDWAEELRDQLTGLVQLLDGVVANLRPGLNRTAEEVLSDLDEVAHLRALELDLMKDSAKLRDDFGLHFRGLDTDWEAIVSALEWVRELRALLSDQQVPTPIQDVAVQGGETAPTVQPLRQTLRQFQELFQQLGREFTGVASGEAASQQSEPSSFTAPVLDAASLQNEPLARITSCVAVLKERLDELRDWIDFQALADDFSTEGLGPLYGALLRRPELRPQQLPNIARRCLLQAWADQVCAGVPALRNFRGDNHGALIAEFRRLDRKHAEVGYRRVIEAAERHRPTAAFLVGGENALLMREANKKRRHLPLRKLFAGMPNLLTRLKPCLLMSPLSVSLFLDPEQIQFDIVVFDEASQMCSEDAVGAVYRGKQLVICGDNRQLPPTSFFDQGVTGDFEEEESETFDVFESILDECAAISLPQLRLRWHYRSRHESLIAFSNHRFYADQPLVTFPAARHEDERLGVKFVFVPDGVYDRSGRRDNEKEADRVVELAAEHLRRSPDRSLGIVTFSMAQRDAIDDRLERVRKEQPELEEFFVRERPDRVFVKNLESVQGDERDVIIFSVGYGRDRAGKLTMHFGPLNQEGGERRLNVAITRARERVIVVSSIRAADMDIAATTRPGVLNLHRYLDYAERGMSALDIETSVGEGDFESPLEASIASAIRALGYDVHPQVGCSGYRIDLGVADPAQPGRFILGVECDGAMYHSAWSARDRDRLRQEQLERLGWKLHRVWGPDWVSRRDTELNRLSDAIQRARLLVATPTEPEVSGDDQFVKESGEAQRNVIRAVRSAGCGGGGEDGAERSASGRGR